jgi:hypothetical protein
MAIADDEDQFIKELRAKHGLDPCDLPKLVVLRGYLGQGPLTGGVQRWRVYINHALTDYYEGDDYAKDVLHFQELPDQKGKLVWVLHDTKLRLVQSRALEAEIPRPPHPLLGGPVTEAYLPAAPPAAPRWVPGYYQPPVRPPGYDWDAFYDQGWEVSSCRGCPSASP